MKFFPKLNKYKGSNLEYDCDKEMAFSYEWYVLAKRFNGIMVLNKYSYSPTTVRHYYKIRELFESLGIDYMSIEAPKGLQSIETAIEHYESRISSLHAQIAKKGTRKSTNEDRFAEICIYNKKLAFIKSLGA